MYALLWSLYFGFSAFAPTTSVMCPLPRCGGRVAGRAVVVLVGSGGLSSSRPPLALLFPCSRRNRVKHPQLAEVVYAG